MRGPGYEVGIAQPRLDGAVGCVGGGSILAPILIGTGRRPVQVAPAVPASTFVTSVAGVITCTVLSLHHDGSISPASPALARLARRPGLGPRRPGRRLHLRPPPNSPARCLDLPLARHPGDRDRRPLPLVGPGLMPALPYLPRRCQYPWEWSPGLESAQPIACDATAGSALDAVAASWTIERRGRWRHPAPDVRRVSLADQWRPG